MNRLVSEVMTGDVLVARPETSFRELVRLIEDHDVGALPVVDELGRVLGVVAETDLLIKEELSEGNVRTPLQRRGRARLDGTTAGEIMSSPAVTINQSQTLSQAARVLRRRHVGRLPVVDDDGRLIGIVTRRDLLTVFLAPTRTCASRSMRPSPRVMSPRRPHSGLRSTRGSWSCRGRRSCSVR